MVNILLLEPAYKNKYPPLGLMKIANFHRQREDIIIFRKGIVRESDRGTKWDRIYITTLFTFEWLETKKTIAHALELVEGDQSRVFVGGIAATLIPEIILHEFPQVNVVRGLLNEPGKLKIDCDESIDTMAPDYSILEQIEYSYPASNAYFAYTTRGCGMNCSFCAVKTLEPIYEPYISIKQQIQQVIQQSGEKRDLLLMDNNVLKSPALRKIIDEIKDLGFDKGAKYISPKSKKNVQRLVDFNQGLDAKLLTQDKADMLGELALRPVRIAFDHIADQERYTLAIEHCIRAGLREYSNYILYNSEEHSSWKGKEYTADTPLDLYNRLMHNIKLQEKYNAVLPEDDRISIYSFPMRYIPLNATERGFVGKRWNKKYLRAVQVMLTPTQGKGVSGRSFFTAAFGEEENDFLRNLAMPEHLLMVRGHWVPDKRGETDPEREKRHEEWLFMNRLWHDWKGRHDKLDNTADLVALIAENKFTSEQFVDINNEELKKLYLYYFPGTRLAGLLAQSGCEDRQFIIDYLNSDGYLLRQYLERSFAKTTPPTERLFAYVHAFGHENVADAYLKIIRSSDITQQSEGSILQEAYERLFLKLQGDYAFWQQLLQGNKPELTKTNSERVKMSLFYCPELQVFDWLNGLSDEDLMLKLRKYLVKDEPVWLEYFSNLIYRHLGSTTQRLLGYFKLVGNHGVNALLSKWWDDPLRNDEFLNALERIFSQLKCSYADTGLLRLAQSYYSMEVINQEEWQELYRLAINEKYSEFKTHLLNRVDAFRDKCLSIFSDDEAGQLKKKQTEKQLNVLLRLW